MEAAKELDKNALLALDYDREIEAIATRFIAAVEATFEPLRDFPLRAGGRNRHRDSFPSPPRWGGEGQGEVGWCQCRENPQLSTATSRIARPPPRPNPLHPRGGEGKV